MFQKYAFFFSCSLNELELYSGELGIHAASYSWTLAEPEQRCCVSQFVIDGGRYSIPLRRLLTPLTTVLLEGCREDLLDEIE
ncbi:hypothetical protein JCM19233_4908 [Vibrio astriarenae]|nr:hypothetical protein JCM19233_4908 [Vibrio sp. C7]